MKRENDGFFKGFYIYGGPAVAQVNLNAKLARNTHWTYAGRDLFIAIRGDRLIRVA